MAELIGVISYFLVFVLGLLVLPSAVFLSPLVVDANLSASIALTIPPVLES
jgi:hypothetical protein